MDTATAFELADTDAIGLGALAATGELSATELLEAAIIRLDAGRELNTVITDLFDYGRARAEALDASGVLRSGDSGPLAGVPFLIKDIGASLAGTPEAMGSRALRTHVAQHTAWIVERYLEAGLVLFGKTNTPEFGAKGVTEPAAHGPARNPWNLGHSPGGSSGGAAAAVAADRDALLIAPTNELVAELNERARLDRLRRHPHPDNTRTVSRRAAAEEGMAEMAERFRDGGSQIYSPAAE